MTLTEHQARIKQELTQAGMTAYGQLKMGSRYLPSVIDQDEHIGGVVYGRSARGLAMLVATDRRILYIERLPLFASTDEIDYDVVSGVQHGVTIFTSVTLHTRIGNYALRFVNPHCATIFLKYIDRKIEHLAKSGQPAKPTQRPTGTAAPADFQANVRPAVVPPDARRFINDHEVGVLSTADRTGEVYGSAVYYMFENGKFYLLTKSDTAKAHNMMGHHQVALTIFDGDDLRTAQIHGYTEIETDPDIRRRAFDRLVKPRRYHGDLLMPPVTDLENGGFITFTMIPTFLQYIDFREIDRAAHGSPGNSHTLTT